MRIAGGTIHPQEKPWLRRYQPRVVDLTGNEADRAVNFRAMSSELLPGFSLVGRDDLLDQRHAEMAEKKDRKSTRLNSSHVAISYAVFCLKKKKLCGCV